MYEFISSKIAESDKKVLMLFKCYKITNDSQDFINSMRVYYNKMKPVDPNVQTLTDLKSRIEPSVFEFVNSKLEDKKMQMLFKIYY
jgi:hypothetical protein